MEKLQNQYIFDTDISLEVTIIINWLLEVMSGLYFQIIIRCYLAETLMLMNHL